MHGRCVKTTLDLDWDGSSRWIQVSGRTMPASPAARDPLPDDPAWIAAVPLENRAAILVIVEEDPDGHARTATARLVIPGPEPGWHDSLEARPAHVHAGRIRPTVTADDGRDDWDWAQGDGWWASIDDASELWRYASVFGALPVDQ